MDKRLIIILSTIILALIGIIVAGVCVLYSPAQRGDSHNAFKIENAPEDSVDIDAVPTMDSPLAEKQGGSGEDSKAAREDSKAGARESQPSSFKVHNCGTGKENTLRQNPDNTIELIDHSGKSLWKKDLSARICGQVVQVDYYANGKIQFLFSAGSKVHLFDRLGREVTGWPLELSDEAVGGPSEVASGGKKYYKVECKGGPLYFMLKEKKIYKQIS